MIPSAFILNGSRHETLPRLPAVVIALLLAAGSAGSEPASQPSDAARLASLEPSPPCAPLKLDARSMAVDQLAALAQADPRAFMQACIGHYDRTVRDYTCIFYRHERIKAEMTPPQQMTAMFREKPFSVRLKVTRNIDRCTRVLYVADRWKEDGQSIMAVEPAGFLARLFLSYVKLPIDGAQAREATRFPMSRFGLKELMKLTLTLHASADPPSGARYLYTGRRDINGRTHLGFKASFPRPGHDVEQSLTIHIDPKTLLPAECRTYADLEQKVLLGHYRYTHVNLNVGLPNRTFTLDGMGL